MYKYMKCVNIAILTKHDASSLLTYAALHLLPHIYFHATSIFQHTKSFVISKRLGLKVDCINTSWCIIKVCIVSWIYCWRLLYYCWSQRRTWVRMSSLLKSEKHLSWITLHFYQNIQHRLEDCATGVERLSFDWRSWHQYTYTHECFKCVKRKLLLQFACVWRLHTRTQGSVTDLGNNKTSA